MAQISHKQNNMKLVSPQKNETEIMFSIVDYKFADPWSFSEGGRLAKESGSIKG